MSDSGAIVVCGACGRAIMRPLASVCPGCGARIDTAKAESDGQKTRRSWWFRVLCAFVVVLVVLSVGAAWSWHRQRAEASVMARIVALGGTCLSRPLGPSWLSSWADKQSIPVPQRIVAIALDGTSASDEDLEQLRALRGLKTLNLSETAVTDAGLKHLKHFRGLKRLVLGGTRVSDAGLKELEGLSNLEMLWLAYTHVSPGGIKALRASMPDTYIYGP